MKNGLNEIVFGEVDTDGLRHGRCVAVESDWVRMAFYGNDLLAVGNQVTINKFFDIEVGE